MDHLNPFVIIMDIVTMTKQLKKSANLTDIHFGRKNNSDIHNRDCLNHIEWFCENVKKDKSIDHIVFMGDWYENRSAINVSTLNWSYTAAKKLNDLNMPIFFIIGNHDLYHRHSRDVHSVNPFQEFSNFRIIDKPQVIKEIGNGGAFITPYLFHKEYDNLKEYLKYETWWGHFEFKGFILTGATVRMPTGPDMNDFMGPKHIFSGHFHKRQQQNNIVYIGNTFPMDFSDANDIERGMMIYDHTTNKIEFRNWANCPKYFKYYASEMIEKDISIPINSYVKCFIDVPLSYEELMVLRETYTEKYNLRELIIEETGSKNESLSDTNSDIESIETELNDEFNNIDDLIINLLNNIENTQLDNNLLIEIYKTTCRSH